MVLVLRRWFVSCSLVVVVVVVVVVVAGYRGGGGSENQELFNLGQRSQAINNC